LESDITRQIQPITNQFICKKTSDAKVDAASRRVLYYSCPERGETPRLPWQHVFATISNVRLIMY
jgi:hypothetical protein